MPEHLHWIDEVADELYAEILEVAAAVAEELAPPPDAHDGREVPRGQYIAEARALSYADPTYVQRDLDALAPAAIRLADGTMGRSPTGLRNFIAKWRAARPDLVALAELQTATTGGT